MPVSRRGRSIDRASASWRCGRPRRRRKLTAESAVRIVDQVSIRAPVDRIFDVATDVERWPAILSHYRWVRFLDRCDGGGTVEMAAWRPFGPIRYPTWWVSEMTVDPLAREIRYRHVRGMTRGMDVVV